MRYFLDFDRTLFDTDRFLSYMQKRLNVPAELSFEEIRTLLAEKIESGELTFTSEEVKPFVYVDTIETLRTLGNDATIITFGNPSYQKMKVEAALAGVPRLSVLYTNLENKGPFLAERRFLWNADALFVDDTLEQLESVAIHLPDVRLFEMRRDGGGGDGRWRVIHSLAELP